MNESIGYTKREERKGFAIAGLVIGLSALLCSFLYGWRLFAILIAVVALSVSVISYRRALRAGKKTALQVIALCASVLAILLSAWFLYSGPVEKHVLEGDSMPHKVNEKGLPGSVDPNLPVK